jgi:tetratricopeptide (TPR) repeat protein
MLDFFISYTQADRSWAEWIAGVLEAAGFSVRLQAWDFRPGVNFVAELHRTVDEAERTLVVLSPDYLNSQFGLAEWTAAFRQDPTGAAGKLLPVKVRDVDPGGLLRSLSYIDLVGLDQAAARERLLAGLARGRARPAELPAFPPDAVAVSWLAAMPEEEIPPYGHLPAGSRMPLPSNPFFVGRQEDLRLLARHLKEGETFAVGQVEIAAATGLGGIGKTQLACEFVHRYGRFFAGGVFWMSFADPNAVAAEVAACGRGLDLHPRYEALPLDQQVDLVELAWQRPLPRLLVFDNCEEEDLLDRWRPPFGGASVLLTSRRARWEPTLGVRTIPLGTLPRSASVELLRRFRPDIQEDDPALDAIAAELGDLPLALHLAGSFLSRYAETPLGAPAAYLESLRYGGLLDHPSLQGRASKISPTRHEAHVARTFALSFACLEPADATDALALALLRRAAFFAPGEPIPRALLLRTMPAASGDDTEAVLQSEDALGRLTALGLLEPRGEGALVMHRLVALFARDATEGGEEARAAVEAAVLAEARRLNETGFPSRLLAWQPHLRAVTEGAWEREDARAARLCDELGLHLRMIGDYAGARPFSERALALWERVAGAEAPETAAALHQLGRLLEELGDRAGARSCYEQALALREKILGPRHPDTATSLNDLGFLLRMQGELTAAEPCFLRALAIREEVLGLDHPDTATSLSTVGAILRSQGDYAGRAHTMSGLWRSGRGSSTPTIRTPPRAWAPSPRSCAIRGTSRQPSLTTSGPWQSGRRPSAPSTRRPPGA